MNRKGIVLVEVFALLFVPGTIPAFLISRSNRLRKRLATQKN